MKYLESANLSSLIPLLTTKQHNTCYWIGICLYCSLLLALYIWTVATVPLELNQSYFDWLEQQFQTINFIVHIVWLIFTLLSTFITIYAITTLQKTVKILQESNPNIQFNHFSMLMHGSLLVLECCMAVLYIYSTYKLNYKPRLSTLIYCAEPVMNTII